MHSKARFPLVYVLCAEFVFVAAFILGTEPFFLLEPPDRRSAESVVAGFGAMVIIATVFGVGAMRRPVASLIGAILASCLLDFATRSSHGTYPPVVFVPFVWVSWLQGRLAYWVLRLLRFARHLITRRNGPSPDDAAELDAEPVPPTNPRD